MYFHSNNQNGNGPLSADDYCNEINLTVKAQVKTALSALREHTDINFIDIGAVADTLLVALERWERLDDRLRSEDRPAEPEKEAGVDKEAHKSAVSDDDPEAREKMDKKFFEIMNDPNHPMRPGLDAMLAQD